MREILLNLAYPLILCGSGAYAGVSCWLRRRRLRRGVRPSDVHPAFFGPARAEAEVLLEARIRAVKSAERIVAAEYARIAALYEEPTRSAPRN